MLWKIIRTETFSKEFKKYRKNREFLVALDKKILKLKANPESIGKELSGRLHGFKSTRLIGKFRLIFKISNQENFVFLVGFDHRKFNYKNI